MMRAEAMENSLMPFMPPSVFRSAGGTASMSSNRSGAQSGDAGGVVGDELDRHVLEGRLLAPVTLVARSVT